MFLESPTIGFNGFSMVFEILRAMVNNGLEVNNGLHVPSHKKVRKINSRQSFFFTRTLASLLDGKVKLSQSMGVLYYCLVT